MERAPVEIDRGEVGDDYGKELARVYYMLRFGRAFSGNEKNCCFLNTGGPRFANISACSGLDYPDDSRSIATADWDFDGDLDLWMTNRTGPRLRFLRNDSPAQNHFLSLRLIGNGTTTNRDAIGARVEVVTADQSKWKLVKTLYAGSGFQSQSSKWLSFGLGQSAEVSHVLVNWPSGKQERFQGIEADGFYTLTQGTGTAQAWQPPSEKVELVASPTKIPTPDSNVRTVIAAPIDMLEINYADLQGRSQTAFVRESGKPVLINLWGISCPGCLVELREMAKHSDEIKSAGLDVVALNVNGIPDNPEQATPTEAANLLASYGFPFRAGMATDDNLQRIQRLQDELYAWHEPLATPISILINGAGEMAVIYRGVFDIQQMLEDVRNLSVTGQARVELADAFPGKWLSDPPYRDLAMYGQVYHKLGYLRDAEFVYRKALKSDLSDLQVAGVQYNLGLLAQTAGNNAEAIEHYQISVQRNPTPIAHNNLAKALETYSRFDEAISHYEKATKLNPNYGQVYVNHAKLLLKQQRPAEAISKLRTAIEAEPDFVQGYTVLSDVLQTYGQSAEAQKILERGLAANPGNDELKRQLEAARGPQRKTP